MEAFDDDDEDTLDLETRAEREAAAEAAAIGGSQPALGDEFGDDVDPADQAVLEAGGGDQDGFELAEHDLIRNASHDDGEALPERDAFTPEHESDRSTAEYGQADEEIHTDD
jgi:hypothetical protein